MTPNYQAFIDLIRVVRAVPPGKFDMHYFSIGDGRGCAMFHYTETHEARGNWSDHFAIAFEDERWLFGAGAWRSGSSGNPAKLELFRRIRTVLGITP